jgi:predicted neuraminidase
MKPQATLKELLSTRKNSNIQGSKRSCPTALHAGFFGNSKFSIFNFQFSIPFLRLLATHYPLFTLRLLLLVAALSAMTFSCLPAQEATNSLLAQPGFLKSEFIYETAPFPSCHASTLVETMGHIVAAWFGGKGEGNSDVGIWLSHLESSRWSAPVEVANGIQHKAKRYPCWNPALFQPRNGPLLLFYKVGPTPSKWWGMLMTSIDGGKTWSQPCRLPEDVLGPIKDKPIQLPNGDLLCGSSTEHDGWKVHMEWTRDLGRTWELSAPLGDVSQFGVIQPTILIHPDDTLQVLCRSRQARIVESWSHDNGKTWNPMSATPLPNPNSGIDAVTLRNGSHLLVYNHTTRSRSPLNIAVSRDGKIWQAALVLENQPGEYSYPAVIQTADGLVHSTYTWHRKRIRHVVIDPAQLALKDFAGADWPK